MKRFISNIKGHKTANKLVADLEKLERKLQDVYNSAETKTPTENGGVKYSLGFNGPINSTESKEVIGIVKDSIDRIGKELVFDEKNVDIRDYKHKSDYVLEVFDRQGNIAKNKILGEVELVRSGAKSTMLHGFGKNKIAAIPAIKSVIENGNIVSYTPNYTENYDRYIVASRGKLDGRVAIMGVVVNAYKNNDINKFYLHEAEIIEAESSSMTGSPDGVDTVNESASKYSIRQTSEVSQEKVSETDSEYLNLAKNPEKNEAKLREMVDEAATNWGAIEKSGKPRILYHRTNANTSLDSQWQEWAELYPGLFDRETNSANNI